MTDHRAQVDALLADYHRSREQLASVQRELAAFSESASSADGMVTATVGARGTLTGLVIADEAYERYRPAELAAHIVEAATVAGGKAVAGAGDLLAPALPEGTDARALLLGAAGLEGREPGEPGLADDDESFEDQSWLEEADWPRTR
ncbi:YbaB/EbfC family nucleoid-associated protein [Saccharomonospora sp. NPDC006951]